MVLLLVLCAVSAVSSICRVFFWSLCPKKPSRASACASSAPSGGGSIEKDTHLDWIHCVLCHYCSYSHVTTVVKIKIYLLMYQIVDKNHKFSSTFLKICNCCSIFPNCMTFFYFALCQNN